MENELTEALISRSQDCAIRRREGQHLFVRRGGVDFLHVRHFVAVGAELLDERSVNVCVAQKLQAASSDAE
jgi:hypothetical protein